jgi:hypothetical protein
MERGAEWIPHGLAFWAYPQYCICIVGQMKWGVGEIGILHLIVSRTACHKRLLRVHVHTVNENDTPLTHPKLLPALLFAIATHVSSHHVQMRLYM